MYEMKDFEDAGEMLQWLNGLSAHDVVMCQLDTNHYWRVMIKYQVPKVVVSGDGAKPRMVRPKGWKPGMAYVPMEDK